MTLVREILHYFSLKHDGNWDKIFEAIKNHVPFDEEEYNKIKDNNKYVTILDESYPDSLKIINNPPFVLYYYGDLDLLSSKYRLSSIGTRKPTLYQDKETYNLISEVEKELNSEVTIISGMAKGLDTTSMQAAIDKKAPVIAVLGTNIDQIYPIESQEVYNYCKNNGLIISEYPLNYSSTPEDFIKRNRIIAGISDVIFVGGGKTKSGTATTIRYAIDNNKDILALPCNNSGDDLTNTLISDGADIVLSSKDIINALKNRYN